MNEEDLERTLREAFDARARSAVTDARPMPAAPDRARPRRSRTHVLAPLAAAAAVVAVVGGVVAAANHSSGSHDRDAAASKPAASSAPVSPDRAVHVTLTNAGNVRYGVGMPVVAVFSRRPTDARSFARATRVTVDGRRIDARWYFVNGPKGAMEAHLRPSTYWPAHARVHVELATAGVPAGRDLAFDDSQSLDFATGARTIAVVDDRTHRLTVTTDGKPIGIYPVSLGMATTPTTRGIKVIIARKPSICLSGPGFHSCGVKYAQQVSASGEYLIAAPWNEANIKVGVNTSNGCTNLMPHDASVLYQRLTVGDVVTYPNAEGATLAMTDGVGDWNVPWSTWRTGGLLPTS